MNDIAKSSVLIVDDIPANIKVLGESLKADYRIRLATDGERALKMATSATPPDIILLDIVMPKMDGYEVCRRLKEDPTSRNIPVIFITAMTEEEDETKGLAYGAVDYITKPFSLPIVRARVKTHLELKRHRDTLEALSTRDGLTGIPNRRRFDEVLTVEWLRGQREEAPISLIMIDIDHFKLYNDNYGHLEGDDCLKKVATGLATAMSRPADFIARYGGEEFAVILPMTGHDGAVTVAETLLEQIRKLNLPHRSSPVAERVTISLGVSTMQPTRDASSTILIDRADKALYASKVAGRNRLTTWTPEAS
jgi:diguanylate cyclase (GGDEF)-like protein